jgi:hypothetical protein
MTECRVIVVVNRGRAEYEIGVEYQLRRLQVPVKLFSAGGVVQPAPEDTAYCLFDQSPECGSGTTRPCWILRRRSGRLPQRLACELPAHSERGVALAEQVGVASRPGGHRSVRRVGPGSRTLWPR